MKLPKSTWRSWNSFAAEVGFHERLKLGNRLFPYVVLRLAIHHGSDQTKLTSAYHKCASMQNCAAFIGKIEQI